MLETTGETVVSYPDPPPLGTRLEFQECKVRTLLKHVHVHVGKCPYMSLLLEGLVHVVSFTQLL